MERISPPTFEEGYGYNGKIEEFRKKEFSRLEGNNEQGKEQEKKERKPITYLDHAGATLYASSQIDKVGEFLKNNVLGNPHSQSPSSMEAHERIEEARERVLRYFNADPALYSVVFTSGLYFFNFFFLLFFLPFPPFFFFFFFLLFEKPLLSSSLLFSSSLPSSPTSFSPLSKGTTASTKLVGEWFPWSKKSVFSYYHDSHNSLLGIRHYASEKGAKVRVFSMEDLEGLVVGEGEREEGQPGEQQQQQQQQQQQSPSSFCLEEFGSPVDVDPSEMEEKREGKRKEEGKQGEQEEEEEEEGVSLIALPAQCNFSGTILPFPLFSSTGPLLSPSPPSSPSPSPSPSSPSPSHSPSPPPKQKKIYTLIDAAAYVGHTPLDLDKTKYDFVVFSFYKIFGYPTGLGALIVRNPSG